MKRYRTLLTVLLGLVLLLQGLAVSAAPYAKVADPAEAEMAMDMEMPCHGQMSEKSGKQVRSCCSSTCPDMTTCALGHIVAAIDVMTVTLPPAAHAEHGFTVVHTTSQSLTTPLRPPISLHG